MQTKLDKFGRIVIPKSVRKNLGLKPGEILQLEESGEKIIIKPNQKEECLSLKDGVLVFTGSVDGDILESIKDNRKKRIKHLYS